MPNEGVVYLIHLSRPYRHARHYLGWTQNLEQRLAEHRAGRGSPLLAAAIADGIELELAATWPGDRHEERRLHRYHNTPRRLCPICKAQHANNDTTAARADTGGAWAGARRDRTSSCSQRCATAASPSRSRPWPWRCATVAAGGRSAACTAALSYSRNGQRAQNVGGWRDRLGYGERPMSQWPDLPTPGTLVDLPLPLPPALCEAAGYTGGGRYLAMWWTPFGDELMLCDGESTCTGWWPAWTTLAQHPLGQALFSPYQLGSSDVRLCTGCWPTACRTSLHIGLALDVRQLLATQPSELAAAIEILGAEHLEQFIQTHLTAPARPPDPREIQRQLERCTRLVAEFAAWLDATLAQLQP